MNATIVDLRYKTKEILKAIERRETVNILYHGKIKAMIVPVGKKKTMKVKDHPLFGMYKDDPRSVEEVMDQLRGGRYRDL